MSVDQYDDAKRFRFLERITAHAPNDDAAIECCDRIRDWYWHDSIPSKYLGVYRDDATPLAEIVDELYAQYGAALGLEP